MTSLRSIQSRAPSGQLNILLMTSTIAPSLDTFLLSHSDPTKRLDDYVRALTFYARLLSDGLFDRIVFVDNSGHSLKRLIDTATKLSISDKIEFISYRALVSSTYSRYYLEINLLVEAFALSQTLKQMPSARIWKVTGRYIVRNISTIVATVPQESDLYLNCRNRPVKTVDFYLVALTVRGFNAVLRPYLQEFQTTRNGEVILRGRLLLSYPGIRIVCRLRHTPRLLGTRGFDGAQYGGLLDSSKFYVRVALNYICPNLWI